MTKTHDAFHSPTYVLVLYTFRVRSAAVTTKAMGADCCFQNSHGVVFRSTEHTELNGQ